jgi:hypothetical protein
MKTLTVRLPAALVADLETEARERNGSKSDIVRERLSVAARSRLPATSTDAIGDLVGLVDGLPADLSGCCRDSPDPLEDVRSGSFRGIRPPRVKGPASPQRAGQVELEDLLNPAGLRQRFNQLAPGVCLAGRRACLVPRRIAGAALTPRCA